MKSTSDKKSGPATARPYSVVKEEAKLETDREPVETTQQAEASQVNHQGSGPQVVVLGAGPAGTGAAYQLARKGFLRTTVLEQRESVGGNAGSFEFCGVRVDYGSHRLHPACDPAILEDLRGLLGDDLLLRPRHGRIRLRGHWIHFPLKPVDLLLHLPKSFAFGVTADVLRKLAPGRGKTPETFASVLEHSLGRTICEDFYFPYARKLWGLTPEQLSVTQARRRVSANSISKMIRKIATSIPGLKPPGAGRFYYPKQGYGQICERLYQAAQAGGAEFLFGARIKTVEREGNRVTGVRYERNGQELQISAPLVWSTLPITLLANCIRPAPPAEILSAASRIDFRGMILIYLALEQKQFTEYDAHYFPEEAIPISRLSEPKNYSATPHPPDCTVLCAELPTSPSSPEWAMSDEQLGKAMCGWLAQAGLPVRSPVRSVVTRRLRQAYPIYRAGYEEHFAALDDWVGQLDGLLTFGRQGLFAHDNTHHALYMAFAAVECLKPDGQFDGGRWRAFRKIFESHVVED
jgi:protoporphyrinogen oxidase